MPSHQEILHWELILNFKYTYMTFNYTIIKKILGFTGVFIIYFCSSCEKKNTEIHYENGAFIVNEGALNGSNGSISFYNYETDSVVNDIFYLENNRILGDVVQSITIADGKGFIVVNNSNKVEVVDAVTFHELGVIEGVSSPRFFITDGTYGYVSCWGDNTIRVIDLGTFQVTDSIAVASGPEKMCISRNKLYVANTGGWATDSMVSVIDLSNHELIKNIEVGYTPSDIVSDINENIWILCFGKVVYGPEDPYPILEETASELYKINTIDDAVIEQHVLFEDQHPNQLEIDSEGRLYYGGGYTFEGIYNFDLSDYTSTRVVADYAYGFNLDPSTNDIYITIAGLYTSAGSIKRYSSDGNLLGTYDCGIGPNSITFN
jgi:YVTN family beta-propeller protein